VTSLVRPSRHPATEPCGSAGVCRFDDPDPGHAGASGICHAANNIELAFALDLDKVISASAEGASKRWDGIRYVSRQMDNGFACAIFERSGIRKPRAAKSRRGRRMSFAIGATSLRSDDTARPT
jgi:hypothetical protein